MNIENDTLQRDISSGALINKNNKALKEYKERRKLLRDIVELNRRVSFLEKKIEELIQKE